MTEAPEDQVNGFKVTPWALVAVVMSILFLLPSVMLMRTAAKASARAAHAARHGFIQLDNEEGALLFQAMQIREGQSIYHPLDKPPYVAGTYTPLYMAAVAAVDDFKHPGFTKGRLIVWGAALGACCLLILLVTVITRNAPLGILAGVGFMATYEVYRWIGYFRVDFPALFFTLAGLSMVVLGAGRKVPLILGAFLMVIALYTKQTMIAAPVACLLALLVSGYGRRSLLFAAALLTFGLPPLIAMQAFTDGQFLRHIVLYNMNTFSQNDLMVWTRHVWNIHRGFFLAGVVALPWLGWATWKHYLSVIKPQETVELNNNQCVSFGFWLPAVIYGILAQWNIFGAAKSGSAENYLLEPLVGSLLLLGVGAGSAVRSVAVNRSISFPKLFAAVTVVLTFVCVMNEVRMTTSPFAQERLFSPYVNPSSPDFAAAQAVRTMVRESNRPLTELAIFPLQADKLPVFQPFIMSELARQDRWDQSRFVDEIKAAKFDLVVAQQDLSKLQAPIEYTEEMLSAFRDAYRLEETITGPLWTYYILKPRADRPSSDTPISDIAALQP